MHLIDFGPMDEAAILALGMKERSTTGMLFLRVLQAWLSRIATEGAFFRLRAVSENGEEFVQWPMRNGARFVI